MADELNKQDLQEEIIEEVKDESEEVVEEEVKEEAPSDTANSEEPSEQKEEVEEEKAEENSDVPPPSEEEEKSDEESDKSDVDAEEEPSEDAKEDETTEEVKEEEKEETEEEAGEDVEKIKAELEELKEAEEERKGLTDLSNLVQNAEKEMDRVLNGIQKALNDTLDQYGIDKTKTLDELRKEDPAKAVIAEDLIRQANQVKEFNENNLGQQVQNKQNELIFKKAEKLFNKYNLSHEQAEVAADTFINIMLNVGVLDLNVDLAAKVELSAARAKMLKPDVVEAEAPIEDVEEVIDIPPAEEAAEEQKDVKEETTEEKAETEETKEETEKKEPEVIIEKPDIEALKEGVADNTSEAHHPDRVTVDNVLTILAKVPFKERTAFYKEHEALINEAAKKRN